ncbi:MAG: DUF4837 family protein [Prevotella sp.]|uniref:DUF4837 family protein n=1 Tax=Prevotella sp. TaxID=59823 RepID=UPI002A2B64DE|nr:DUF4837 family protein [Prevotella sp.]MDD7317636.1 DUF4837 family protein [Prevotellaceae bacterium]MDY4020517.1 DUF4837 family protein [Prevotella sp.]
MRCFLHIAVLLLCVTACTGNRYKPSPAGSMFEVFVASTTDDGEAVSLVCSELSMNIGGLPQAEPQFDAVRMSYEEYESGIDKRSTVLIEIDPARNASPEVTWVSGDGMMRIFVRAGSRESLAEGIDSIGNIVRAKLQSHEMAIAAEQLRDRHNPKAEQKVWETTGIEALIPPDLMKSKQGEAFIWLSNDALQGMKNICIYSYPGTVLTPAKALTMRDSVLGKNIVGETAGMRMATVAKTVTTKITRIGGNEVMVQRGLWEMTGDAMGGPFVSVSRTDPANNRIVVKEAFVYAPERRKRNILKPLEAAIFTEKENRNDKYNK